MSDISWQCRRNPVWGDAVSEHASRGDNPKEMSVPRKQKRAHSSTDYLEKVLAAGLVALNDI